MPRGVPSSGTYIGFSPGGLRIHASSWARLNSPVVGVVEVEQRAGEHARGS